MKNSQSQEDTQDRRELVRQLNPIGRIRLRLVARIREYLSDLTRGDLNFTWITENLAAGGSVRRRDLGRLAASGVTAVIDVRSEARDDQRELDRLGIQFLHLPAPDRYAPGAEQLLAGVDWALRVLERGGKIFSHCEHGVGRGPLMACAILVAQGRTAPEALEIVREKRWQAAPNDRQIERLLDFERLWLARTERSTAGSRGL